MVQYLHATDEQKEYADVARTILEKELLPIIEQQEHADEGRGAYPMEVHQKMAEAGFFGMNIPEEWGGLGLDVVTQALIAEEMAKIDAGFTFSFYNAGTFFPMILASGLSKEEKQEWADGIVAGEKIGCFCITESEAGSDVTAMKTKAVKDGDEWVINGVKCFASNGPIANYFLVAAWTDRSAGASKGITFFLVEKDRGVEVGKKETKMGLKLSETSDVIFNDVRVPEDHVIGEIGKGLKYSLDLISNEGRAVGMSFNLGLAEAALDKAVEYAKELGCAKPEIVLHLDHGDTFETCKSCIDSGFSSVMIDGSHLPYEENVALTKKVVDYAHQFDVTVEGELGVLAGVEDEVSSDHHTYTDPEEVIDFATRTGCDSLAISIGTSHGAYKFTPEQCHIDPATGRMVPPPLAFEVLDAVMEKLPGFPIVLHGSSSVPQEEVETINKYGGALKAAIGIPEEELRKAAKSAVCKINIDSDSRLAMTAAIRQTFAEKPAEFDPRKYLGPARDNMEKLYKHKIINVLGSDNKLAE